MIRTEAEGSRRVLLAEAEDIGQILDEYLTRPRSYFSAEAETRLRIIFSM